MKKAEGTIQTTFRTIIPFLLFISKTRITNGKDVTKASEEKRSGAVYSIHITPFLSIGLVNPFKEV